MKLNKFFKVFAFLVAAIPATMSAQTTAKLYIEDFNIDPGQTKEVEIIMENPDIAVWQAQLDVRLPEGLNVVKEDGDLIIDLLRNSKRNKHTLEANETEGVVRILVTTTGDATIQGTEGAFISISLKAASDFTSGNIKLEKMKLVPLEGSTVVPEDSECKVNNTAGIEDIPADGYKIGDLYDLQGRKVTDSQLSRGIYIMNGRKYVVK
jgi:hypothetical protein